MVDDASGAVREPPEAAPGPEPPEVSRESLQERLAEARTGARGRIPSKHEEIAATIAAYGVWKTLRRERRRKVETVSRFRFTSRPKPPPVDPQAELARLYAGREELLEDPDPPSEPPEPEDEAQGADGGTPPRLPSTWEWWKSERARQAANPFKAGRVAIVGLNFRPGERPVAPPGHYLVWGPQMVLSSMSPDDRAAVLKILAKDIRAGGCEPCSWEDVDVVLPVHLVRHPVTGKPRLTHDSRPLNVRLLPSTAEMARAEDALLRGTVAAKLDLLMAFRHVSFAEQDRRMMGFMVDGVLFRWTALTFGCSQSPALFAEALARTIKTISLPGGACAIVYVDDILIVAPDAKGLDAAVRSLCEGLASSGWYVALDKTYPYAMSRAPFLGLLVDLSGNKLRVTKLKAQRLGDLCRAGLDKRRMTLRDLQRVGGLLAFMAKAAPEAGLCRHGINAATAAAEGLPGRTIAVKGQLQQDLRFWAATAASLPALSWIDAEGPPLDVATDASGLPTLGYGGLVWPADAPAPDIDQVMGEAAQFAANPRSGAAIGGAEVYAGPLPDALASHSSSALETRSLLTVLVQYRQRHGNDALRGRVVRWMSDSAVAVGAVSRWRAKAGQLVEETVKLLRFVRVAGCRIVPQWVSREAGWQPIADALSKVQWRRATSEWRVAASDARNICKLVTDGAWSAGPEVDLFASKGNQVADRYVSWWPEKGNAWTDAFARPWEGVGRAWGFPPFSAAAAALRHVCRGAVDVVLLIPRSTAVPARLRGCRRTELPPLHLLDASGHRPPQKCPVPLDAVWVTRGANG